MGVIAQLHQSTLADAIRGELGITDKVDSTYKGENAVRAMPELSQINTDEPFEPEEVIFLGEGGVTKPEMHYRKMGSSDPFTILSLVPVSSSHVMKALTLANPGYDLNTSSPV